MFTCLITNQNTNYSLSAAQTYSEISAGTALSNCCRRLTCINLLKKKRNLICVRNLSNRAVTFSNTVIKTNQLRTDKGKSLPVVRLVKTLKANRAPCISLNDKPGGK